MSYDTNQNTLRVEIIKLEIGSFQFVRYRNINIQSKFQISISKFQLLFSFKDNRKWLINMARNFTNTSCEIRCGVSFCKKDI